jgi:hypothetical protein
MKNNCIKIETIRLLSETKNLNDELKLNHHNIEDVIEEHKKLFCDKIKDIKKFINRKSDNNV